MRLPSKAHSSLISRYSSSRCPLAGQEGHDLVTPGRGTPPGSATASRPCRRAPPSRGRGCSSPSSARRTFCAAVSASNGGNGGRVMACSVQSPRPEPPGRQRLGESVVVPGHPRPAVVGEDERTLDQPRVLRQHRIHASASLAISARPSSRASGSDIRVMSHGSKTERGQRSPELRLGRRVVEVAAQRELDTGLLEVVPRGPARGARRVEPDLHAPSLGRDRGRPLRQRSSPGRSGRGRRAKAGRPAARRRHPVERRPSSSRGVPAGQEMAPIVMH